MQPKVKEEEISSELDEDSESEEMEVTPPPLPKK